MYKVSKINPKDTILDEIHSIQKKHYDERRNLSWIEEKKIVEKEIHDFEKTNNIKFKTVSPEKLFVK